MCVEKAGNLKKLVKLIFRRERPLQHHKTAQEYKQICNTAYTEFERR